MRRKKGSVRDEMLKKVTVNMGVFEKGEGRAYMYSWQEPIITKLYEVQVHVKD